jgi:hypothetical protein
MTQHTFASVVRCILKVGNHWSRRTMDYEAFVNIVGVDCTNKFINSMQNDETDCLYLENFVEYGHTYLEVTRHLKEKISDKWRRHPLTDRWDAELVKWQRQHPSRNIQKKTFSSFVGIIWTKSNRTLSSSAPETLPRWTSRTKVLPSTHPCCLFYIFFTE